MLYKDKHGRTFTDEQINEMDVLAVEEAGIHSVDSVLEWFEEH